MMIINLIFGLVVAAGFPLGLLWLAIQYANKQDKKR